MIIRTLINEELILTKRELFAAMAMQGLLSDSTLNHDSDLYAKKAIRMADELLKELEK